MFWKYEFTSDLDKQLSLYVPRIRGNNRLFFANGPAFSEPSTSAVRLSACSSLLGTSVCSALKFLCQRVRAKFDSLLCVLDYSEFHHALWLSEDVPPGHDKGKGVQDVHMHGPPSNQVFANLLKIAGGLLAAPESELMGSLFALGAMLLSRIINFAVKSMTSHF